MSFLAFFTLFSRILGFCKKVIKKVCSGPVLLLKTAKNQSFLAVFRRFLVFLGFYRPKAVMSLREHN